MGVVKLNLTNVSSDVIELDPEQVLSRINVIKNDLSNVNASLNVIKGYYIALRDDGSTKGDGTKVVNNIITSITNAVNSNKASKSTLETNLSASITEYQQSMDGFDDIDTVMDDESMY